MKFLMLLDFGICSIQIGVIAFQAITVSRYLVTNYCFNIDTQGMT